MTLADLDPFDIFEAEAARLDRFFGSLDGDAWLRPSRCEGWNVRDVLGHLAGEELYNHACLDGTVDDLFARLHREGVGGGFHGFNEWCVRERRGLPVAEVLAEWRAANPVTRRRMRERGRDGTLQTAVGSYPVGLQAFHYASEFATHADDVGAPVADAEQADRIGWRAQVGMFVLAEQDRPVTVTPSGRGYLVQVDDAEAELAPPDFVEATVDRLPAGHPLDPRLRGTLACLS